MRPRPQTALTIQNDRLSAPAMATWSSTGCCVRLAVARSASKTNRPLAALVGSRPAGDKSACSFRSTTNDARPSADTAKHSASAGSIFAVPSAGAAAETAKAPARTARDYRIRCICATHGVADSVKQPVDLPA